MVAVTGDDNAADQAPTDSTGAAGTVPAGDETAPEPVTTESNETSTESDEVGAVGAAPTDAGGEDGAGTAGSPDLEQESEIAADYIEGLLDVADLDGDIDMDVEGDRPVVSVVGATLSELVGPRGEVLEALQELTRLAVHRQTGARSRIMLDLSLIHI